VLATTNHPEKLDPAIRDRPSRFDRKYYFPLPAETERLAYILAWNGKSEPELRLSDKAIDQLVRDTAGYSFAYLKELFLSSVMQWLTKGDHQSMDDLTLDQALQLRSQMSTEEISVAE